MPVNPRSPKKKAKEAKKMVVNFSPSKEELTIDIDGKNVRYFNADKVLELIEQAKKYKPENSEMEVVVTCNACGVDNGHSETCELNNAIQKENPPN